MDPAAPTFIDDCVRQWRQGDFVLGEHWFVYRTSRTVPQTEAGRTAADAETDLAEVPVRGLVVVIQTSAC